MTHRPKPAFRRFGQAARNFLDLQNFFFITRPG
jgi:hypothetical protein